jgi:hypothetical protein
MKAQRCEDQSKGLEHIRSPLGDVLKELLRRIELRPRMAAEMGRTLSDEEFIAIAEKTGLRI